MHASAAPRHQQARVKPPLRPAAGVCMEQHGHDSCSSCDSIITPKLSPHPPDQGSEAEERGCGGLLARECRCEEATTTGGRPVSADESRCGRKNEGCWVYVDSREGQGKKRGDDVDAHALPPMHTFDQPRAATAKHRGAACRRKSAMRGAATHHTPAATSSAVGSQPSSTLITNPHFSSSMQSARDSTRMPGVAAAVARSSAVQ